MLDDTIVHGLVKRRSELTGEIEHEHQLLKQKVLDLEHIDAVIRQFDADYKIDAIKPKAFRPPDDWANRGEMSRVLLDLLRQASEPLTSRYLAHEMLIGRALDSSDEKLLRKMTKRVGVALRQQRDNGLVKSSQGPGMFMVWEITKSSAKTFKNTFH